MKCHNYGPSVVQCYNRGHDGLDVNVYKILNLNFIFNRN